MSTENAPASAVPQLSFFGIEEVGKKWGWFLALGILLIIAGTIALGSAFLMSVFSMLFLGWLMIATGIVEAIHAFACQKWSGFFINLLSGILYIVVGFMVIANPGVAAVTLTLLIAMFLIFGGIFRIVIAVIARYPNWGWVLLHGVINLLLGIMIWQQWPASGLWVIGLFVGIDMIFNGWSLVMLGLFARNQRKSPQPA